jgi:N-acetylglutamate synthase-like GNAT family acetyltransferase
MSPGLTVQKTMDPNLKAQICDSILRSLPLWFGIESAIVSYVNDVRTMETWTAFENSEAIGFASVRLHFPQSAEIHVMGIRPNYHHQGIGHRLIQTLTSELREQGIRFLTVKTLSASRPNPEYDQTRQFYLKEGFVPLEEFKTLWDETNPCLFMVKSLS